MNLKRLREICLGNRTQSYSLEKVDILSPYLSEGFFTKLKKLRPREVNITTDAGCSSSVISRIQAKLGRSANPVRLAWSEGLVHAKCYLFHWKNFESNRYKRLLLWGSCNATDGGFGRNAEVFSWLLLSSIDKEQRTRIIRYFSELKENDDGVDGIDFSIQGLTVEFPCIEFFKDESGSFDLWLQKGRLCHPFPNDPGFRHLRVELLSRITADDNLSAELRKNRIGISQQTTIAYDYLRRSLDDIEQPESEEDFTVIWKSRFFVDTVFGFWTSQDCFNEKRQGFHKRDTARRQNEIQQIAEASRLQRMRWNEEFLAILQSIYDAIPNSNEYFHHSDGKLDAERYRKQFDRQLNRDFFRAQDSWFKHGYISGYDFPEVPPMREFSRNWDEFVQSFADSLFFEINKSGTRSLVAKAVREWTDLGAAVDSEDFLKKIRRSWKLQRDNLEFFFQSE
jgi:hypothetical protein